MAATDERYTPPWVLDYATRVLALVDCDPCYHPDSPVVARVCYTQASTAAIMRRRQRDAAVGIARLISKVDGLRAPVLPHWRVWANVPFSDPLPWVQRLFVRHSGPCLVMVRLDTQPQWARLCRKFGDVMITFDRRVRYVDGTGAELGSPEFCSALYLRAGIGKTEDLAVLERAFSEAPDGVHVVPMSHRATEIALRWHVRRHTLPRMVNPIPLQPSPIDPPRSPTGVNGSDTFDVDQARADAMIMVVLAFLRDWIASNPDAPLEAVWRQLCNHDLDGYVREARALDVLSLAKPADLLSVRRADPDAQARPAKAKRGKKAAKERGKKRGKKTAKAAPSTKLDTMQRIHKTLRVDRGRSSSEIAELADVSKRTAVRWLNHLKDTGAARTESAGGNTKWLASGPRKGGRSAA